MIYIVIEMTLKTVVLFVAANYDWLLPESKGHASGYITDLVAFLQSTFMSFTNLPVSCQLFFKGTKVHNLHFNFSLDYQNSYKQTYAERFFVICPKYDKVHAYWYTSFCTDKFLLQFKEELFLYKKNIWKKNIAIKGFWCLISGYKF